jgi:transcriptional regulator with XRE-family HTH domain
MSVLAEILELSLMRKLTLFAALANVACVPSLGKRIRDKRQELGLTVRGFAARIEVAPPFVTDIEADRRRPSPDVLGRIARVLEIPLDDLQALDPRLTPEVKEWMDEEPRVSSLLRRLRDDPDRDALLRQIEQVVDREQDDPDKEQ